MNSSRLPSDVFTDLAEIGRFAASHGWVPATSGNFSCRIDANTIAITRSGADKGTLTEDDVIAVSLDRALPPGVSAETPLHVARYRADASIGAIAHIHSVAATVLSRVDAAQFELRIDGYEMQKSLAGFDTHESSLRIPIFANAQDTDRLAASIEEALAGATTVPAYLLAGHGIYVWGATMRDTRRHLEGIEFMLRCTLEERRIRL